MMAATGIGRCQMLDSPGSTNVLRRSFICIESMSLIPGNPAKVGMDFLGGACHRMQTCPTTAEVPASQRHPRVRCVPYPTSRIATQEAGKEEWCNQRSEAGCG